MGEGTRKNCSELRGAMEGVSLRRWLLGEAQSRIVLHGLRQGKQALRDLGRDD